LAAALGVEPAELLKRGAPEYWEEIDYGLVDTNNIDESFRFKYALDMLPFAQIYAYRTDGPPKCWGTLLHLKSGLS
jgi:putative spermidine/putrescine transport system substrate-binding protein